MEGALGKKKASKSTRKRPYVVYSDHARSRMNERRISESQVESAIFEPTSVGPGNDSHTLMHLRTFPHGKLLAVILNNGGFCINVITVYWK